MRQPRRSRSVNAHPSDKPQRILDLRPTSEGREFQTPVRQNSAIIVADVRRFAHVIDTDGVLGTHTAKMSTFTQKPNVFVLLRAKIPDFPTT